MTEQERASIKLISYRNKLNWWTISFKKINSHFIWV